MLHALEERIRGETDFRRPAPGDKVTGPDPFLVRALPGGNRFVGLLRGSATIVLLDRDLGTIARAPAPRAPTGLAVGRQGEVFVSGELASEIARYRVTASDELRPDGHIPLGAGRAIRDITRGPGDLLYAVDERADRLVVLHLGAATTGSPLGPGGEIPVRGKEIPTGRAPIRVMRAGPLLVVNCLLEHAVLIFRVDAAGEPDGMPARIQHDGPLWSLDVAIAPRIAAAVAGAVTDFEPNAADLMILAGGVEDHPLDRTIGSFGYIDSFLYLYRVPIDDGPPRATRLGAINLAEAGVVTPKVIDLELRPGGGGRARVTGYGSELLADVVWQRFDHEPVIQTRPLVPGTTSVVRRDDGALLFADPLLDAWIIESPAGRVTTTPVAAPESAPQSAPDVRARTPAVRLGEALFFTTLMAPWNRAQGPTSRFTCETCHFEGGVDGRTHHTGRGDVRATTKSLRGLLNNRPYFSRALDPDLATMVGNEFRVAGANSGHDPWFDLRVDQHPWLRALAVTGDAIPALELRAALISFLATFSPWPNPAAVATASFTDAQRAGARLFRARCEGCHQARLVSDDETTRVPFDQWERLILDDANPLVWGTSAYEKTGIVPYVHEQGARVPSLRRLSAKSPYFTNGSAKDLTQLVSRARFSPGAFAHGGEPDVGDAAGAVGFDATEAAQVAAFLQIL